MRFPREDVGAAFHDADTNIVARIVARMSACCSACHKYSFRKLRASDVSARILAEMSVSWNVGYSLCQ